MLDAVVPSSHGNGFARNAAGPVGSADPARAVPEVDEGAERAPSVRRASLPIEVNGTHEAMMLYGKTGRSPERLAARSFNTSTTSGCILSG